MVTFSAIGDSDLFGKNDSSDGQCVIGDANGVTLMELLIVMVFLAVIGAIIGPGLAEWYRKKAIVAARDQFVSTVRFTRSTAVRYGRMAELHIDASNNEYWIELDTSGTNQRDTIGSIRSMSNPGIAFTSTRQLLCFDTRGLPTTQTTSAGASCDAADVTVVFTAQGGEVDTVQTTALGKVLR